MNRLVLLFTCFFCSLNTSITAQQLELTPTRFAFEPNLPYDLNIQSPAEFLGYALGERFTEYTRSVEYFHYLAEKSDRIMINQYGETYEQRPLLNLVVSNSENLSNIEMLRSRHLKLTEAGFAETDEGSDVLKNDPVFTSLSYNIHGNEASSTEAAMQVAYRLAAAQDDATLATLENSVMLLFICINPDGRDRYVYWINGASRQQPGINPLDFEHYAPWPNGRTNHYWFDLNRDWIWGVHPESRGHTAEYQRWMPQVHVDYHEQGYNANYFTAPGATPRNLLLPDTYEAWSDTFGRANIAAFDREGLMYFTRDRFDFFYPGYGSSYPSVMGAIGMLTEQGGISAGRAITTNDGYILTLRQRIFDHYTTSLATIHKAAEQRETLLRYSVAAWNPSNSKSLDKTYVVRQEDGGYLQDFLQVMHRQGVQVKQATADFSLTNSLDYRTGQRTEQQFKAGDYIILADQPRYLFVHSLLARNMAIEDSVMYDMATWSAPMAYNLEAYSSPSTPSVKLRLLEASSDSWTGAVNTTKLGGAIPYAYVLDWNQRWAPKALGKLWERGYRVRAAAAPFFDGETEFSAGSLIVLRGRNLEKEDGMAADMAAIAEGCGVAIWAQPTGRMQGGFDLASSRNSPLKKPRVAMLVEPPFNTYTSGQVYFLFDQETAFPIDRIRTSAFAQTSLPKFGQRYGYADISNFDVLILPGGNKLESLFEPNQRYTLKQWVEQGGTIIALENAASFFIEKYKFGNVQTLKSPKDTSEMAKYLPFGERESYRGLKRIPGSALRTKIDTTHPLGFGIKEEVFGLKLNTNALIPNPGLESVGTYHRNAKELLTAGYAATDNLERLAGKTFAGVQRIGKGRIVHLIDNPHYRMFWRGNSRMIQNAAFILPAF